MGDASAAGAIVSAEPAFVVEAAYVTGAAEKRAPFREVHLERMAKLEEEGALVMAGAYEDLSASLLVLSVGSEKAVKAIIESDVFWKNNVWDGYSIMRLNRVIFDG
ncbi:MAG: YciI family protein [Actinomycetota bacterium]